MTEDTGEEHRGRQAIVLGILHERQRQVNKLGFDEAHDDSEHAPGDLATVASAYAFSAAREASGGDPVPDCRDLPMGWPWHRDWWKPKNTKKDLYRAGALIVAELERIQRAEEADGDDDEPFENDDSFERASLANEP